MLLSLGRVLIHVEVIELASDCRLLRNVQIFHDREPILEKENQEYKQHHIDDKRHEPAVHQPHQQKRADVEEGKTDHEELETLLAFALQMFNCFVHGVGALSASQRKTRTEHIALLSASLTNVEIMMVNSEKHIESVVVLKYPSVKNVLVPFGILTVSPPYVKPEVREYTCDQRAHRRHCREGRRPILKLSFSSYKRAST